MPQADRLKLTEIFLSLQGEARSVGLATVFVRLTGCPLRCQYCDIDVGHRETRTNGKVAHQWRCARCRVVNRTCSGVAILGHGLRRRQRRHEAKQHER